MLTEVVVRFQLYDGDKELIGFAVAEYGFPDEIYPGEVVPFRADSDVDFDKVNSYELMKPLEYVADRIPSELIPTSVEKVTWGALKTELKL